MKRSLACAAAISALSIGSALAADMPAKAPVTKAPVAVAYNWTGFYVGVNIGGGWGRRNVDFAANDSTALIVVPPPASFTSSGVLGGVQIGYNWHFNRSWILGIETDFDWSGMKGSGSNTHPGPFSILIAATIDEHIKWFGTVRARLGYLPTNNLLTYATGGFAYGKVERDGTLTQNDIAPLTLGVPGPGFSAFCAPAATCFVGSSSDVVSGWTAGGGVEYAVWKKLTLKAEYLYVSLDSRSLIEKALVPLPGSSPASFNANFGHTTFNVARVGLNYRF